MPYLPGNIRTRVKELRTKHNMTQDDLAKILGVDKGTISRLEKEEEKSPKISCDLLVKIAEHFHVSADFLLGRTTMPEVRDDSAEKLGLTVDAARAMLSRSVHMGILNRLLENQRFCQLTYTMYYATEPNQRAGIMSRNNVLAYAGSLFMETTQKAVQTRQKVMGLNRKLGAELIDPNTVGNQQMEEEFRGIISQIRRDIQKENPVSVMLTRQYLAEMDTELLNRAQGNRGRVNPRMVAEVVTDKSRLSDLCTPQQRTRFVDLLADILTVDGGENLAQKEEAAATAKQ